MDDNARRELEATVAARRELGPEHDEHLIAGFLDRIEQEIDHRVEQRVEQRVGHRRRGNGLPNPAQLGPMVPIVIGAGIFGGPVGIVAALVVVMLMVGISVWRR